MTVLKTVSRTAVRLIVKVIADWDLGALKTRIQFIVENKKKVFNQ